MGYRLRIKRMNGCFESWAMLTAGYSCTGQGKAAAVAKQMSQPSGRNVPKPSTSEYEKGKKRTTEL